MVEFINAQTTKEYEEAAVLFREYAKWLNIDLCFQNFEAEIQQLDTMYVLPAGGIILCKNNDDFVGCVGIRRLDDETAELKRMWVKPLVQGAGIGATLLSKAIILARECGYTKIRLDTLNSMTPAINLCKKHGFVEIQPYYKNPDPRAMYFEMSL